MMESHQKPVLSYGARREVLAQIASRYQQATGAQKTLLLGRAVDLTGYGRKYIITLLHHPPSPYRVTRPRLPIYGPAVQEALFLAWQAIQYPCAQRLVPYLPKLIPVLERDGHLKLDEEHRRQLLTMSIRTAERLLRICQHSEHGQKMAERFPHFSPKTTPIYLCFPHLLLILQGAFPTFGEHFSSCSEF
jgi:hypothetical protein